MSEVPVFCLSDLGSKFAAEIWEQRPAFYRSPSRRPLIDSVETFRAVRRATEAFRQGEEEGPLAFYIEHAQVVASVIDYLPRASDGNLERYSRRISRRLDGRPFGLIVQNLQAYSPVLWRRLMQVLQVIDAAVPAARMASRKATLFIGNYRMTPSGLHVGDSSNFKFVLRGQKRMRLWPDRFFRDKRVVDHTTHLEPFLSRATTVLGKRGDVIYWPSDQWHVGEAVGGLSVSLSLAIFVKTRMAEPTGADEKEWAKWLNHQTGGGFASVPAPASAQIRRGQGTVRRCSPRAILWRRLPGGEILCSANGRAFAVKGDRTLVDLLERLNADQALSLEKESRRSAAGRGLLQKLHQLRAIAVS